MTQLNLVGNKSTHNNVIQIPKLDVASELGIARVPSVICIEDRRCWACGAVLTRSGLAREDQGLGNADHLFTCPMRFGDYGADKQVEEL